MSEVKPQVRPLAVNTNPQQVCAATINEAAFETEVLRSERPVIVAFCAPWSHPCGVLDPTLEEVAAACAGRAKVVKVNADDNPELSLWYGVQSVPTLLYFVAGTPCGRLVGTASKEAILAKLGALGPGGSGAATPADSEPPQIQPVVSRGAQKSGPDE